MTVDPAELTAESFVGRATRGELPREFLSIAARGFLPFTREELVAVLAFLSRNEDPDIASTAVETLREMPGRELVLFAQAETSRPLDLDALADATTDAAVLDPLLRNRSTPDATVTRLASRVSMHLQDVIITNQERILRAPEILDALEQNASLSPDIRRRILETREEFFDKLARKQAAVEAAQIAAEYAFSLEEQAQYAELLDAAAASDTGEQTLREPPSDDADEEKMSLWNKIFHMTVSQKVQCAIKGGKTERSILIRDRNKVVATSVVRNARITESEIEAIAGMRNIEEDVLRIIGMSRDWMGKYAVLHTLVRNPKAPLGVVLPLINRLTLRDLRNLSSDRNVPEAVRASARKLFATRKPSS